jgi:hypothetical protein
MLMVSSYRYKFDDHSKVEAEHILVFTFCQRILKYFLNSQNVAPLTGFRCQRCVMHITVNRTSRNLHDDILE